MAKIFGDDSSERVAVKESNRTTGVAKPSPQFSSQGRLAGAG
jgi:hypothetical protein